MKEEIWKTIDGFDELYEVSSTGNVRKKKNGKAIRQHDEGGWLVVHLVKKKEEGDYECYKRRVAYLVARHFVSNPFDFKYVSHRNGNKKDNRVDNLYWCKRDADSKRYVPLSEATQLKNKGKRLLHGSVDVDLGSYGLASGEEAYRCMSVWRSILSRCYNSNTQNCRPTYKGCYINEEWKDFAKFYSWYKQNYREGYHLDKDIIKKGNKEYGPDFCCFVPQYINSLLNKRKAKRGSLPIGVSIEQTATQTKYVANFRKDGKLKKVGRFNSAEDAFNAYKKAKEQYIRETATTAYERGEISQRAYEGLMRYQVSITD